VNVLGEIRSYSDLHDLMRARATELEISREVLDEIAGFQRGYSSKLLAPKPQRRMGNMSISVLLPALGTKLLLVADPQALERIKSRLVKRNSQNARQDTAIAVSFTVSRRFLRQIGRIGGANSRKYMSPERASEIASKAGKMGARARWKNGG
jgi:hypothetical protein